MAEKGLGRSPPTSAESSGTRADLPQNGGFSPLLLDELLGEERAGEPAPCKRIVGGERVQAPRELWKVRHQPANRRDSVRERRSAARLVEILREGRHGAPLRIDVATRVAADGEQLDRAAQSSAQLGLVHENRLTSEEHQRHLRFDRLTARQPFLELLEERALRRTLHSRRIRL